LLENEYKSNSGHTTYLNKEEFKIKCCPTINMLKDFRLVSEKNCIYRGNYKTTHDVLKSCGSVNVLEAINPYNFGDACC